MQVVKLFTGQDNLSYFTETMIEFPIPHPLGHYSKKHAVENLIFREFEAGLLFDWHNAPQVQYVVYLAGAVEVEASGGEKRIFLPGDILLATDITGAGHVTRTLEKGRSVVVTEYSCQASVI